MRPPSTTAGVVLSPIGRPHFLPSSSERCRTIGSAKARQFYSSVGRVQGFFASRLRSTTFREEAAWTGGRCLFACCAAPSDRECQVGRGRLRRTAQAAVTSMAERINMRSLVPFASTPAYPKETFFNLYDYLLEAPLAAPGQDLGAVTLDEFPQVPGSGGPCCGQPQKRYAGQGTRRVVHRLPFPSTRLRQRPVGTAGKNDKGHFTPNPRKGDYPPIVAARVPPFGELRRYERVIWEIGVIRFQRPGRIAQAAWFKRGWHARSPRRARPR
jgi:hypothetical protein